MTEDEVAVLKRYGPYVSTPATPPRRLDALVDAGDLNQHQADALFAERAFHTSQRASRSDKSSMVSHPVAIDDGGVEPLMAHWGGQVARCSCATRRFWRRTLKRHQ